MLNKQKYKPLLLHFLPKLKSPILNFSTPHITVVNAILTDHTIPSIKTFLGKFLQLLEKHNNKSHQIKIVELDFSWGFNNSIIEAFSQVDTKTYINRLLI